MKNQRKSTSILTSISILALGIGTLQAAVVTSVGTTGVFDSNSNTNSIDVENPSSTLAAFKTTVSTAYSNNLGGVIDWTTGAGTLDNSGTSPGNTLTSTISITYGAGAGETLSITFSDEMGIYTNNVNNQVAALSNGTAITPNTGNDVAGLAFTMTFSDADVVEIGAGMLARTNYLLGVDFRAIATFSDASTSLLNYTLGSTLGDGVGSSDTFLHFTAPGGETISSLLIEYVSDGGQGINPGGLRPIMDDFGFVVAVPEPSTALLGGLGLLALLRRRRN